MDVAFGYQLFERCECLSLELHRKFSGAFRIRIANGRKLDRFTLLRQLGIDSCMVAPKGADADHCDADFLLQCQWNPCLKYYSTRAVTSLRARATHSISHGVCVMY